MSVCRTAMDGATSEEAKHIHQYKLECENAVASVIGYVSRAGIKRAEAAVAADPKNKRKQRNLEIEYSKNEQHKKLFKKLNDYIMERASELNYDRGMIDPKGAMENWRQMFARRLKPEITPKTTQQGARLIHALNGMVDSIIKKREKMIKKGRIPAWEISLLPPEYVASYVDPGGKVLNLINKALRTADKDVQMVNRYKARFDKIKEPFVSRLQNIVGNSDFNLNNSVMEDGIEGFLDRDGNEVVIIGEGVFEGIDSYKIKDLDDNGEPIGTESWIDKDDVLGDKEDINNALISQYSDALVNELADGQTRLIVPKVLNWDLDDYGMVVTDASGKDLRYIKKKIEAMQEQGKYEDGNRVPGIHEKEVNGFVYRYIMIKQGEDSVGETYNAYLISKAPVGTMGKEQKQETVRYIGSTTEYDFMGEPLGTTRINYSQEEINEVIPEGYYKSNDINDFGRRLDRNGDPIDGTHQKQYVNFEQIADPNPFLMEEVYQMLFETRQVFKDIWVDISNKVRKLERKREKLQNKIAARKLKENPDMTEDELQAFFNELYSAGGIDSRIWWDSEGGKLRTANTWSKMKSENYIPHLYEKFNIMYVQIPKQLKDIRAKKQRAKRAGNDDLVSQYETGEQHLQQIILDMDNNIEPQKLVDLQSVKPLKHITAWTDQTQRRKDSEVYTDYLSNMYSAYHKNEIIVDMLDAIDTIGRMRGFIPGGVEEYLKNRIKISFGDSDTRMTTPYGREGGYGSLAQKLNWVGGVREEGKHGLIINNNHTPESAERLVKWITTPATMRFLGSQAAVGNHTQILNMAIRTGFRTWLRARKLVSESKTNGWDEVIDNTGVLNIVTMFQDIMLQGGDIKGTDFGFLPGTLIPGPNMIKFGRLLSKGRDKFIESSDKSIDDFLIKLIVSTKGRSGQQDVRDLRNINKLRKLVNSKELADKKGALYDIFTLGEDQTEAVVKAHFKKLVGDIADRRLKQMVSWKLSWAANVGALETIFTFTGGEEYLRKTTIVMALLDAKDRGLLGEGYDGKDMNIYKSRDAVKIARDAVYNTQFGMTPQYLGEMFNGMGRAVWQYKQYPTLQMIHDFQITKAFTDGNQGAVDGSTRIFKAFTDAMIMRVKKGKKYDPKDPYIDQEALAMGRFIFTRATASVIASMMGATHLMSPIARFFGIGNTTFNMMRSAENPAFGLAMRLFVWGAAFGMGYGDEEEDGRDSFLDSISIFFLPVLLGALWRDAVNTYDWLTED